jgi:hypothetical protein
MLGEIRINDGAINCTLYSSALSYQIVGIMRHSRERDECDKSPGV